MANAQNCILWVLRQEDSTLNGQVVNLGDGAGLTRFGITKAVNPPADFYTKPTAAALADAINIYTIYFWNKLCGDHINYEPLAASMLSFAINDGEGYLAKLVQHLVNVPVDGNIGPQTVAAINAACGPTLLATLQRVQLAHYEAVAAANPNDEKDLGGWTKRALRTYPSLA